MRLVVASKPNRRAVNMPKYTKSGTFVTGVCSPGSKMNPDNQCMVPGTAAAPGSLNTMPFETVQSIGGALGYAPLASEANELLTPAARALVNARAPRARQWGL
jgi:hypothetical protein